MAGDIWPPAAGAVRGANENELGRSSGRRSTDGCVLSAWAPAEMFARAARSAVVISVAAKVTEVATGSVTSHHGYSARATRAPPPGSG